MQEHIGLIIFIIINYYVYAVQNSTSGQYKNLRDIFYKSGLKIGTENVEYRLYSKLEPELGLKERDWVRYYYCLLDLKPLTEID